MEANIIVKEFCEDLNGYLMNRFNYEVKHARCSKVSDTVSAFTKQFNLYIRFQPKNWGKGDRTALVLSAVEFKEDEKGEEISLLKFLLENQSKYGYKEIGIEQCSEQLATFARKFKFKSINKIGTGEDFTISVEDLRQSLQHR